MKESAMTRAAFEYATNRFGEQHKERGSKAEKQYACREGFYAGVEWYKTNLWHTTDEIPDIGQKILIQIDDKFMSWTTTGFIEDTFKRMKVLSWCYIDDL